MRCHKPKTESVTGGSQKQASFLEYLLCERAFIIRVRVQPVQLFVCTFADSPSFCRYHFSIAKHHHQQSYPLFKKIMLFQQALDWFLHLHLSINPGPGRSGRQHKAAM